MKEEEFDNKPKYIIDLDQISKDFLKRILTSRELTSRLSECNTRTTSSGMESGFSIGRVVLGNNQIINGSLIYTDVFGGELAGYQNQDEINDSGILMQEKTEEMGLDKDFVYELLNFHNHGNQPYMPSEQDLESLISMRESEEKKTAPIKVKPIIAIGSKPDSSKYEVLLIQEKEVGLMTYAPQMPKQSELESYQGSTLNEKVINYLIEYLGRKLTVIPLTYNIGNNRVTAKKIEGLEGIFQLAHTPIIQVFQYDNRAEEISNRLKN